MTTDTKSDGSRIAFKTTNGTPDGPQETDETTWSELIITNSLLALVPLSFMVASIPLMAFGAAFSLKLGRKR